MIEAGKVVIDPGRKEVSIRSQPWPDPQVKIINKAERFTFVRVQPSSLTKRTQVLQASHK